jgi:hypothetical protein
MIASYGWLDVPLAYIIFFVASTVMYQISLSAYHKLISRIETLEKKLNEKGGEG